MTLASPDNSAGVTVTCRVPAAGIEAFEAVLRDLLRTGAAQPGQVGAEILRGGPTPGGHEYHIVYRFADAASLIAWEGSAERWAFLGKLAPLMAETRRQSLTGMEAWFDLPPGAAPPSRHRMAVITWIGIWPLVSLALWQLAPRLGNLPFLVRTGLTTAVVVVAMTYVVMPRLARLTDPWLRPSS